MKKDLSTYFGLGSSGLALIVLAHDLHGIIDDGVGVLDIQRTLLWQPALLRLVITT